MMRSFGIDKIWDDEIMPHIINVMNKNTINKITFNVFIPWVNKPKNITNLLCKYGKILGFYVRS